MNGPGVLLQQTEQFVNDNPTDLILKRNAKAPDGAGGTTSTPTPLSPQTVRIVQASESNAVERQNAAGEVVRPALKIVCMPDTDIERGDTFTWMGMNAEVVWLTALQYEITADVAVR